MADRCGSCRFMHHISQSLAVSCGKLRHIAANYLEHKIPNLEFVSYYGLPRVVIFLLLKKMGGVCFQLDDGISCQIAELLYAS